MDSEGRPLPPGVISRRRALALLLGAVAAAVGACRQGGGRTTSAGAEATPSTTSTATAPTTAAATTAAPTTAPAVLPTTTSAPPTTAPTTTAAPPASAAATPLPNPAEALFRPAEADGQQAGFLVIGDFGGGAAQPQVAEAMTRYAAGHRVDALVTTGDNVYDNGEPAHFAAQLDVPYRELRAAGRPLWATLGNHDVVGGHAAEQLRWLGLPAGPYRRDLPGVRLLLLDTYSSITGQARWLDEQLSMPGPAASVVVFHAPVHSAGLHGPYQPLVRHWKPVIERHRVPLVINGHDHLYQRFGPTAGSATTYVVTGGGGRELYARNRDYRGVEPAVLDVTHHFVSVAVYDNRLVVGALTPEGREVDRFELPLTAPAPAPLPVG